MRPRSRRSASASASASWLVGLVLLAAACGTDDGPIDGAMDDDPGDRPAATDGSTEETTMSDTSDRFTGGGGDAFLVVEVDRFGVATQELQASAAGLEATGGDVTLAVDVAAEDRSGRQALVLVSPSIEGAAGRLVLTVSPSGSEPIAVGGVRWTAGDVATTEVEIELTGGSGSAVAGRWGYSLRPRVRSVVVADDEQAFSLDSSVVHQATVGSDPVDPSDATATDGGEALAFTVPAWLSGQLAAIERCELLADRLSVEASDDDLRLPEGLLTATELDRVAAELDGAAADGRSLSLTVEVAGREIVRGQRLQPLVSYPITVVGGAGEPVAARLGCSLSG